VRKQHGQRERKREREREREKERKRERERERERERKRERKRDTHRKGETEREIFFFLKKEREREKEREKGTATFECRQCVAVNTQHWWSHARHRPLRAPNRCCFSRIKSKAVQSEFLCVCIRRVQVCMVLYTHTYYTARASCSPCCCFKGECECI